MPPNHCTSITRGIRPPIASLSLTRRGVMCTYSVWRGTTQPVKTTGSTRRSPGGVLSLFPAATLWRCDQFLIAGTLVLITVLAWSYLIHFDRQMLFDMEHDKAMAAMGMTVY